MFYSNDLLTNLAKRLAMLANDRVYALADAVANGSNNAPEITGAILGMMPHLIEKAIVTNTALPGDVSVKLCSEFLKEFEALVKIVSNAGGFSNPIKKALFNASFHTMFSREYASLRPKFNGLWEMGREQQTNPVEFVAYGLVKYCESSSGLSLENEESIEASCEAMLNLFGSVHDMLRRA